MTRARPDAFVLLFPVSWDLDNADTLTRVHAETWQERAAYRLDDTDLESDLETSDVEEAIEATGTIAFEEDGLELPFLVESAMDQLDNALGTGKDAFQASEAALLKQHSAIWRVVVEVEESGVDSALRAGRIMSTFARAGAAGVFLPAIVELHSPTFVKEQTKGLAHEQSLTNLFVSAWDEEDWMRTRGLTCFGLPELETPVEGGLNAAYFRLMDTASGVIAKGEPYPVGARLDIGPASFEIDEGPRGPEDQQVPIAGTFGVQTLMPR